MLGRLVGLFSLAAVSVLLSFAQGQAPGPAIATFAAGCFWCTEVVQVVYDPAKVSYERLLEQFWVNHDPTVLDRQFCDAGSQYRPEIFYHTDEQKRLAEASKARWQKDKPFRQPILTPDYYLKNPIQYKFYVTGCGRYARLDQLWGRLRK